MASVRGDAGQDGEPYVVAAQVRQGRCPGSSRRPRPVKSFAKGRQLVPAELMQTLSNRLSDRPGGPGSSSPMRTSERPAAARSPKRARRLERGTRQDSESPSPLRMKTRTSLPEDRGIHFVVPVLGSA